MAHMGFRTVRDMVGRADFLEVDFEVCLVFAVHCCMDLCIVNNKNTLQALRDNPKLQSLDLTLLNLEAGALAKTSPYSLLDPELPVSVSFDEEQDHALEDVLDTKIITASKPALEKVHFYVFVTNQLRLTLLISFLGRARACVVSRHERGSRRWCYAVE